MGHLRRIGGHSWGGNLWLGWFCCLSHAWRWCPWRVQGLVRVLFFLLLWLCWLLLCWHRIDVVCCLRSISNNCVLLWTFVHTNRNQRIIFYRAILHGTVLLLGRRLVFLFVLLLWVRRSYRWRRWILLDNVDDFLFWRVVWGCVRWLRRGGIFWTLLIRCILSFWLIAWN